MKALAGEIAIGGKLPIALPGLFPIGHGLLRLRLADGSLAPWLRRRRPFPTPAAADAGAARRRCSTPRSIVALAEILRDVEQHEARVAVDEQLPVAVAHRALIEAGRRDAPEQRALDAAGAGPASSGSRSMPSSLRLGRHRRAGRGEDRGASGPS